jgi:N-dimethylarginine dimethylaminohydrolase
MKPAVLMGDPQYFQIKGGSNPHTRNRWGRRKKVDRERAIGQWHSLAKTLAELGVAVFTLPAVPQWPGTVFPANAGFLYEGDFFLSNLAPARQGEREHYQKFLVQLGFKIKSAPYRFEGEADFFPAGDGYLLTYGTIRHQCFVPHFGIPPWKRVYGFRTDSRNEEFLRGVVQPKPVYPIRLMDEFYYHGDTVLCSFGPQRKYLLGYLKKIELRACHFLQEKWGDSLIELSNEDGEKFIANSFYTETEKGKFLVMPAGVTKALLTEIQARGVAPIEVEVSEFMSKGGGSIKCMICDLGRMSMEDSTLPREVTW